VIQLDYSPDSAHLLSCSADCLQLWTALPDAQAAHPGAMMAQPHRTLELPRATTLRIAKVHPAWSSVLLATNEALEVRELRWSPGGRRAEASVRDDEASSLLSLKWRRDNLQVTAAAFTAQGNMLVVSDRGDRLLLLNYHGLQPAKVCALPWLEWARTLPPPDVRRPILTVTAITECPDVPRSPDQSCSGPSYLAVSSSWGEVLLLNV